MMVNKKTTHPASKEDSAEEKQAAASKTFKEAKKDPSVNEAMKKEKQPTTMEDLSPLHNTKAVGTSGGDQRATVTEQAKAKHTGHRTNEHQ